MFLRRTFVEGRRSALRRTAYQARHLHSSALSAASSTVSLNPDGTGLPGPANTGENKVQNAIDVFHTAMANSRSSPRASYDAFVSCIDSHGSSVSEVSPIYWTKIQKTLALLARSRYAEDILTDAVRRVSRLQDVHINDYARDLFSRIVFEREARAAYQWLLASLDIDGVTYTSDLSSWHEVLELAAELRDQALVEEILRRLQHLKMRPTRETSAIIFQAVFRPRPTSRTYQYLPPPFVAIKHLINILPRYDIPFDQHTLQVIVDGYTRDGQEDFAKEAAYIYISVLGSSETIPHSQFNEILADVARRKDRQGIVQACKRFMRIGFTPSEETFIAVLGDSALPSDLRRWEKVLQIKPSSRVITRLMEQQRKRNVSVLELWKYVISNGIPLTGTMLHYVVEPLLTSRGVEGPTEQAIDAALDFYREFVVELDKAEVANQTQQDPAPSLDLLDGSASHSQKADQELYPGEATYRLILRALTKSSNVHKYLPVAVSLLEDMRRFGVRLAPETATSILVLLMSASSTPAEAFEMYRLMCSSEQFKGPVLDQTGYVAILDTFCKLPTWPDGIPSTQLYFQILTDMRKRGVPLGPKVYTVLLGQMGKLATATVVSQKSELQGAIAKTIMRVHNHLTVNPSFTPDTPLYNQLMDAYQRAGCFAEACRIWQMLFASGQFNQASVSIILDACAFARAYDFAVRVYRTLNDVGFPMNIRNWNAYIECLCRLGRLDEAMKVVCLEMTGRDDGIEPDKESARILLKFAMKSNQEMEVRDRLKRFLPKLYSSIRELYPA
ncbi:hypothetical protein BD414DRAFT_301112 [Trametes punicea]|nr:hypothetical protein BD414DRAFT_301112 [Trametes punicea]